MVYQTVSEKIEYQLPFSVAYEYKLGPLDKLVYLKLLEIKRDQYRITPVLACLCKTSEQGIRRACDKLFAYNLIDKRRIVNDNGQYRNAYIPLVLGD